MGDLYQWETYISGRHIPVGDLYQWETYTSGRPIPVGDLYQWEGSGRKEGGRALLLADGAYFRFTSVRAIDK